MATANQKAINAAVDWAVKIANDNTFHYGRSKWGHKSGCYFCGTQSAKRKAAPSSQKKEVDKTYCCNPFATAAFHHGAGAPSVNCKVKDKRIGLANDSNKPFKNTKEWKRIAKKKANLKKGDLLLTPTHIMLYIGNGKIVHAAHHDNGPAHKAYWNSSICVQTLPAKQWGRTTKIYRYIGNGKFKDDPKFIVGRTYELQEDMNMRKGAGTNTAIAKPTDVSEDARKHLNEKGELKKGTRITCKGVKTDSKGAIWILTPSKVYICGVGATGKEYVK